MMSKVWHWTKTTVKSVVTNKYLLLILIVAIVLRCLTITNNINSPMQTYAFNTDEYTLLNTIIQMEHNCTLNPHFFIHPSLYLYICSIPMLPIYLTMGEQWPAFAIICRCVSLLFGMLSIIAAYWVGKELYNKKVGLLTAFFLAFLPTHISLSAMIHPDTMALFFLILAILYCVRIVKNPKTSNFCLAALFSGLATSTKYVGIFVIPVIIFAYFLSIKTNENTFFENLKKMVKKGFGQNIKSYKLLLVVFVFFFAVFIGTPYSVLSPIEGALGFVRVSLQVTGEAAFIGGNIAGWFPAMVEDMGIVLFVLCLIGVVSSIYSIRYLFKKDGSRLTLIPLSFVLIFFSVPFFTFTLRGIRFMLPIMPFILLFGADALFKIPKLVCSSIIRRCILSVILTIVIVTSSSLAVSTTMLHFDPTNHDTRYLSADWMEANMQRNASIYADLYIYIPETFQNVTTIWFEPPKAREIYNNTQSTFDKLVISVKWIEWIPPMEYVNKNKPEYIIISFNMYENILSRPEVAPDRYMFYRNLFDNNLNYTYEMISSFSSENISINIYDFGISAIIEMARHPDSIWTGPSILIYRRVK